MKDSTNKEDTGTYVQLFIYRAPRKNHDAMVRVQSKLEGVFAKHGTLKSEYFVLSPNEPFKGCETLSGTISTDQDEEVWLELDFYTNRKNRDEVMAKIGQDPSFRQLFQDQSSLFSEGTTIIMNEFNRLDVQAASRRPTTRSSG